MGALMMREMVRIKDPRRRRVVRTRDGRDAIIHVIDVT